MEYNVFVQGQLYKTITGPEGGVNVGELIVEVDRAIATGELTVEAGKPLNVRTIPKQ